jgi:hypothetical protein
MLFDGLSLATNGIGVSGGKEPSPDQSKLPKASGAEIVPPLR